MHTNWQVCSLVVQAKSERISDISTQLSGFPGCEVAVSDAPSGQLIVVVEAEDSETLIQTIVESVRNVEGVLAVSLVYHQQEEQGEETPWNQSS
ncbi:chaperone NapD [Escherichia coli]